MNGPAACLLALAALLLASPARADTSVTSAACSIASTGSATDNHLTCNFGLTPEQLKAVVDAVGAGATGPLLDRIQDIAGKLGVTEAAAKALLKIVGEQTDVPDERLAEVLTRVAQDYMRLRAQVAALNPDNPTAQGLVAQAKAAIDSGHFPEAHRLLAQARQAQIAAAQEAHKLREHAQAAEDAQMLGAAASAATEGDLAMTEGQYAQAAELFAQAAGSVPSGHTDIVAGYTDRQAHALYRQGDERGDNAALEQAIALLTSLGQQQQQRARVPLVWAAMQNQLGNALATLGERESGTAHLDEAVAAFRAALTEDTRARAPLDWAMTQNNLGATLEALGERESGTAHLDEAVAAFRAALTEYTQARVPLDWATTQNNLGIALETLGERESGTAHMDEAVAAYRAALQERTQARVPLDWATTQNNLGSALATLGERESGTAHLDEAVAAYRAALTELTQARVPLKWAMTQNNLGIALATLGERESGTAHLDEAVAAYHAALQERTQARVPLDWATTQNNLGNALAGIAERRHDNSRLRDAIAAWDACLTVTATAWPAEWVQWVRDRRDAAQAKLAQQSAK